MEPAPLPGSLRASPAFSAIIPESFQKDYQSDSDQSDSMDDDQRVSMQRESKDGQEGLQGFHNDDQRKMMDGETFQPPADVNSAGENPSMDVQFTPLPSLGPLPFPGPQGPDPEDPHTPPNTVPPE